MIKSSTKIVIVGGGTGGLSLLNHLAKKAPSLDFTLVEPNHTHYYQPLWTLVGAGVTSVAESRRATQDYIPRGTKWIKQRVASFEPDQNRVILDDQSSLDYDYLIVSPGIQIDLDKIEGLAEGLGTQGICTNYLSDHVEYTWQCLKAFSGGEALFTFPNTPIKCAGAPQKIMYLAEETFRNQGVKDKSKISFISAGASIFGVQKYREALEKIIEKRNIATQYGHNLVKVSASQKTAVFEHMASGEHVERPFDFIHVTPPMSAPDFIKKSPLANPQGWLDVDKHSLQHNRFKNIFGLGDANGSPNAKTGAAIRRQGPVVAANLLATIAGQEQPKASYSGYASCPLVTSRSSCILAEFDYSGQPTETFPFNQAKERYSMYMLKRHVIPFMYWNAMMKGNY